MASRPMTEAFAREVQTAVLERTEPRCSIGVGDTKSARSWERVRANLAVGARVC